MGASSTVSLQSVFDFVMSQGSVAPFLPAGGYTTQQAITIGTDVMKDILAERFNHKFNSFMPAPFYTISWQQDYPQVNLTNLGWGESCEAIDINNTALPKPINWPQFVRDQQRTSWAASPVSEISWEYNSILYFAEWPGPNKVYTNPLGAVSTPTNPHTAIQDSNGNMYALTTYGTTAAEGPGPLLGADAFDPENITTVNDGTCIWTVCNPQGQGFRIAPLPPQSGVVYKVMPRCQAKPPIFMNLAQLINPIPDDYAGWFRDGADAYCYRLSPDPKIKQMFEMKRQQWLDALAGTRKAGDRERDGAKFVVPGMLDGCDGGDPGPANPYNWAGYTYRG